MKAKFDGLTGQQQKQIVGQHHNGRTIEQISEHWGVSADTVKDVLAHRAMLDDEKGIIRLNGHQDDL